MVFSSLIYLFAFLPLALAGFYLVPHRARKVFLLCASLLFYFWGENFLLWIVITSTFIDYFAGLMISGALGKKGSPVKLTPDSPRTGRQRAGLILSICANLSFLGYFKYFNFFVSNFTAAVQAAGLDSLVPHGIEEIALPLGISFYTFQSMSYTIDVYRGQVRATRNFWDFACYVTMFPQLVAGPIVRYRDIEKQLRAHRLSADVCAMGIRRFVYGLAKKVLIANSVGVIADGVFSTPAGQLSLVSSWLGIVAYTLQIYFDFSGYSDMAIGLGMMFGFRFPENFNFPYIARSIKEFWRRWHISLSTWFRDYLYIPLGGNRSGGWRVYRNLVLVFVLCGFWHGAEWTFIVWGVYHGAFLVLERMSFFDRFHGRLPRPAKHVYAMLVVLVGWVFFRAETMGYAIDFLKAMAGMTTITNPVYPVAEYFAADGAAALVFGSIFACPLFGYIAERMRRIKPASTLGRGSIELLENLAVVALLGFCAVLLSGNVHNPFLYFRF